MTTHVLDQISVLSLVCWVDIKVILKWITGNLQRNLLGTYKALKITCSLIEDHINLKWLATHIRTLQDVWSQENPYLNMFFFWMEEQYHERMEICPSLLPLLWRQNLWHALRPQFNHCGCGNSS